MYVYLPIAEMSVNIFVLLAMGGAVGFLSGMFGVGGGFLMTPLLIFYNIPPAVAVGTEAAQVAASSFSGTLANLRRGAVDIKLGLVLLAGGLVGSVTGVQLFGLLQEIGQLDLVISILYVVFLGGVGSLMMIESVRAIRRARATGKSGDIRRPGEHNWIHALPFKMKFRRSKLYLSAIPVLLLGALVGMLASIMGVGGGFIMVPALIYLLRVPTNVVIGTSLFQIMVVTAFTTIMQATYNITVDVILALVLIIGSVIGTQLGVRAGQKLKAEQLRALLALIVLAICSRLLVDLILTPSELFSITSSTGGH